MTTEVQITSDVCETALSSERTPPMTPLGSPMQCPWSDEPFPQTIDNSTNSAFAHNHLTNMDEELGIGGSSVVSPPPAVHGGIHGSSSHGIHSGPSTVYQATSTTVITSPSPPHSVAPVGPSSCSDHMASTYRLQPQVSHGHRTHGHLAHSHHLHRGNTPTHLHSGAGRTPSQRISLAERGRRAWHRFTSKLRHMDPIKLAYLRTSFVFAISVLVTWTPSSINRVYTLVHPTRISYGLNIASAIVLPLQGVWNAVIYFSTSWNTLRDEVGRRYARSRWMRRVGGRVHGGLARLRGSGGGSGGGDKDSAGRNGRIPGIVVAGAGEDGSSSGAPMGTVLSSARSHSHSHSRSHSRSYSHPGSSSRGMSEAGLPDGASAAAVHGHGRDRCDEIDTESDSLDGLDGFNEHSTVGSSSAGLRVGSRRLRPAASLDLEACPPRGQRSSRSPPRLGTLRVQRGGELDT